MVVFREIRMIVEGAGRRDQLAEIPARNLLGDQHLNGGTFQSRILGLLMPRFLRACLRSLDRMCGETLGSYMRVVLRGSNQGG